MINMTEQEFTVYRHKAMVLFNYMNGRINTINRFCTLSINWSNYINRIYANIRYPSTIVINIGNVYNSWLDEWSSEVSKEDYIVSSIAWTIAHELFHADQVIDMPKYNRYKEYKDSIEIGADVCSYMWVSDHAQELSQVCGSNIIIDLIDNNNIYNYKLGKYEKFKTIKDFYIQTIRNVIVRDEELFNKLEDFADGYSNVFLKFDSGDGVCIKKNGRFLDESLELFNYLVNRYALYDSYYIVCQRTIIKNDNGTKDVIIDFQFNNKLINPMVFDPNYN